MPSLKRPTSTLAQMALSSNQYALKMQRQEVILAQKAASNSARMAKLWQFSQGYPKPAFCVKVQTCDQKKFFNNRPKSSPHSKTANSTLAQMALSSNQYALKVQRLDKILAHKEAPKVPEWPSYGNFRQVTQTRIFLKRAKGGPREIFQKSPKRQPSLKTPICSLAQVALSSNQYALKVQRLEIIWAHKAAIKVPEWPSYGNFRQVTQTRIF